MLIYKIEFPNGKVYIGKTKDLENRKYHHYYNAKNGNTLLLYKAFRKYGANIIWHIIENCNEEMADYFEKLYIEKYKSNNIEYGYNLTEGGDGGNTITNNPNFNEIISKQLKTKGCKDYMPLTSDLKEKIKNDYLIIGLSIRQIVKNYSITKQRITRFLKSESIKINRDKCKETNSKNVTKEEINLVIIGFNEGKPIKSIAKELKLTIMIVSRILHDNGIRKSKRFENGKRW